MTKTTEPEAIEALQMLKFPFGDSILQGLEELIGHQTPVPEDVHAFIKSLVGEFG